MWDSEPWLQMHLLVLRKNDLYINFYIIKKNYFNFDHNSTCHVHFFFFFKLLSIFKIWNGWYAGIIYDKKCMHWLMMYWFYLRFNKVTIFSLKKKCLKWIKSVEHVIIYLANRLSLKFLELPSRLCPYLLWR